MDILVTVDHLAKSFGAHDIFDKVSFTIRQGEKLGLVGVNGSGKTTLLRCLMDPSFADKGTVQYAGEIRVGYVEQGFDNIEDETIWEFMLRSCPDILSLRETMKELERESGEKTGDALKDVLDRYGRVETRYAHLDGYHYENNIKRVLMGLGYPESTWEHNALALSGGQKTRLQLAAALVNSPDLLILDEPTNHLDIMAREAVEAALEAFDGTVLVVSHDRYFVNEVADRIWEIEDLEVKDYKGNYDFYLEEKQKKAAALAQAQEEAEKAAAYAEAQAKKQQQQVAAAPAKAKKQEDKKRRYSPDEAARLLPKVELQIREQEAMMGLLEKQMADPANHTSPEHSAAMAAEHEEYEQTIAELMEKWELLMEAAEDA